MARFSQIREIEQQIRASKSYHDWVRRNKASKCLKCDDSENLECHHVVELYHILLGLWKLHGDAAETLKHAMALHDSDMCEAVTLCAKCHTSLHPGRSTATPTRAIHIDLWTTIPRNLSAPLAHAKTDKRRQAIGLLSLQTLLGIGWYVLNGHMESRIIEFNRRRFAEIIGKKACTSFNRRFDSALRQLKRVGILLATHRNKNHVEIHISKEYLDLLAKNPWFFPLGQVPTKNMCVLTLRLFLSMQSRKTRYRISLEKIRKHLGMLDKDNCKTAGRLRKACEAIPWAKFKCSESVCTFTMSKRKAVPIHSLRTMLDDSIEHDG